MSSLLVREKKNIREKRNVYSSYSQWFLISTVFVCLFVCFHVGSNVGATITAHHLLYNRNALFSGGICPHYYCLPILKRETHRQALIKAATSGSPKFFLGTKK